MCPLDAPKPIGHVSHWQARAEWSNDRAGSVEKELKDHDQTGVDTKEMLLVATVVGVKMRRLSHLSDENRELEILRGIHWQKRLHGSWPPLQLLLQAIFKRNN